MSSKIPSGEMLLRLYHSTLRNIPEYPLLQGCCAVIYMSRRRISVEIWKCLKSHVRLRSFGRVDSLYVHVSCSLTVHFRPRCIVRACNFLYAAGFGALYGRVCISCQFKPPVALGSSRDFNPRITEGWMFGLFEASLGCLKLVVGFPTHFFKKLS